MFRWTVCGSFMPSVTIRPCLPKPLRVAIRVCPDLSSAPEYSLAGIPRSASLMPPGGTLPGTGTGARLTMSQCVVQSAEASWSITTEKCGATRERWACLEMSETNSKPFVTKMRFHQRSCLKGERTWRDLVCLRDRTLMQCAPLELPVCPSYDRALTWRGVAAKGAPSASWLAADPCLRSADPPHGPGGRGYAEPARYRHISRRSVRSNDGSQQADGNGVAGKALGSDYCHSTLATSRATESPFRSSSRWLRTWKWSVTESMTAEVTRISPVPAAAPTRAASWTPLPK